MEFRQLNLTDVAWPLDGVFDVVFCRNVLMYLEACHRYAVLERIASLLRPGGLLLLDPSEHLGGAAPLFVDRGNGAYSRRAAAGRASVLCPELRPMTIAKRLLILLSIPLVTLVGLGVFMKIRLDQIEERGRFVAETADHEPEGRGDHHADLRGAAGRRPQLSPGRRLRGPEASRREGFERRKTEVAKLVRQYEDTLISDDRDRRLTTEVRERTREWIAGAEHAMALAAGGDQEGRGDASDPRRWPRSASRSAR